ncbi:MAG: hypothetical protein FWE07_01835 [Turicibacter sp.]|nr:hypothetical protein [Turicibacter sp.]
MNITLVNATEEKGNTQKMKDTFLNAMGEGNLTSEVFLPRDFPGSCIRCYNCTCETGLSECPFSQYTVPLWEKFLKTNLFVFILPADALNVPEHLNALLDHYYASYMADAPEANMISRQAVVLTADKSFVLGKNTREMKEALNKWGFSYIHTIQQSFLGADTSFQMKCERTVEKIKSYHLSVNA